MKIIKPLIALCFIACLSGCNEAIDMEIQIIGLWQLDNIQIDGQDTDRTNSPEVRLLIEPSGIYRNHNLGQDGQAADTYGTWHITDNTWVEFTCDSWRMLDVIQENAAGAWTNMHVPFRFTVLSLTEQQMTLRIKCYEGEIKYSSVFDIVPDSPQVSETDTASIERIMWEYRTLKTHVFNFSKVTY